MHPPARPALVIAILGPFRITLADQPLALAPGSRAQALLTYLLLHYGRPIERTYLAAQIEPDQPDRIARRRLSDALYQLRQVLPAACLVASPNTLTLALTPDDRCDLLELEQLLSCPPDQIEPGRLLAVPEPLIGPELDYEWLLPAREALRLRLLSMLEQTAALMAERGAWRAVRDLLQRLLQIEPMRDSAQQALLRAFEALGATAEALRQYEQWRERLHREFGFSPEPATERAYAELSRSVSLPHVDLPTALPLVGRDEERCQLLDWMDAVGAHAGLVLIEGGAGIGKSHLLGHLADDARWRDWAVAYAGAGPPGSVIERALQALLTPLQHEQVAALLPAVWHRRLLRLFPTSLSATSAPTEPEPASDDGSDPQRYRELILRLVEALTVHTPLLLMLDDLHMAGDADLGLLVQIAALSTTRPLLIVASYRSSIRDDPERWPALQRLARLAPGRLRLEPLSPAACATLLRRTIGPCSSAMVEQLAQFSGGYPLLLREALDLLVEQGALQRGPDGRWRCEAHCLDPALLPDADHTIGARLAHLDPAARMLLDLVAVHGRPLGVSDLAAITGWIPAAVVAQAQELIQRHLLRANPDGYDCGHDLIDQALQRRLSPETRRAYHRQLFATLGTRPDASDYVLGRHALGAEAWGHAVSHLLAAAIELRQRADYRAALRVIDQALTALAHADLPVAEAHERQCALLFERVQIWRWYPPTSPQLHAADLEQLATRLPPTHSQRLQLELARIDYWLDQGANQAALEHARFQLAAAGPQTDLALLARLACQAGKAAQFVGAFEEGVGHLEQARNLAAACGAVAVEVAAIGNLAIYQHFAGDFDAARCGYSRVRDLCTSHGLIMDGMVARANLAALDHAQGRLAEAMSGYEAVINSLERYAAVDPPDLENLAEIAIQIGAFERAEQLLTQAAALWAERGGSAALTICRWVTLALARHDLLAAQTQLDALQALIAEDQRVAGEFWLWQSLLALEQGRLHHVEPALGQAEQIYAQLGVHFYHALLAAMRALSAVRQGRTAVALAALQQAEAALAERAQSFVDPRYLLGLAAEALALPGEATRFYQAAWHDLETQAATLAPDLAAAMRNAPFSRRIGQAVARLAAPAEALVRLPLKSAPTGRPLQAWEEVAVLWRLPPRSLNTDEHSWRREALRQLIEQATHQEAAPTFAALARALGVSVATVSRELQALRQAGTDLETRGMMV